jgi:hypothetical protein
MLSELIAESDAAVAEADATAEREKIRALDPALSPDPRKARQAMEDATFAANRLRTLQPRLRQRLQHVAYAEAHARWLETYTAVKEKRDAAAEELKQLYPEVVGKLVELLTRIRSIDAEVRAVNERKPVGVGIPWDGNSRLLPVEYEARGVDGFREPEHSLDRGVRLPHFEKPGERHFPPHEPRRFSF